MPGIRGQSYRSEKGSAGEKYRKDNLLSGDGTSLQQSLTLLYTIPETNVVIDAIYLIFY